MSVSVELVERSVELKHQLLESIQQRRFDRAVRRAIEERFGPVPLVDEKELANFLDWFIMQERLPDGRTVVETFVAEHPDLPEEERAMLLGWHDVVEGIFEVKRRDGPALVVVNLLDDLTYRVRSNVGPAVFRQMPRGSFLVTRMVPIGDEWLLSGMSEILPAASRADVYRATAEFATQHPELAFRNPEKLARAWELQREDRDYFIAFFGADLVVVPGHELAPQMAAYGHFRNYEAQDADGTTAAERAIETYGVPPPRLDFQVPAELSMLETVGLIYDEHEGLGFFPDFGLLEETFANPALAADHKHREVVIGYLQEPSLSPLPFWRLAERDPERASQVFQRVLKRPRFSWERDGDALLRRYKTSYFERPVLPTVAPLSGVLAQATMTAPEKDRPRPDYHPSRGGRRGVRGKRRGTR